MEMGGNINKESHVGPLAVLTSYGSTVFFVKRGDILFVSKSYELDENPLLAMYAFLCAATGAFKDVSLDLPVPNTTWLPNDWESNLKNYPRSGIPRWCVSFIRHVHQTRFVLTAVWQGLAKSYTCTEGLLVYGCPESLSTNASMSMSTHMSHHGSGSIMPWIVICSHLQCHTYVYNIEFRSLAMAMWRQNQIP